MESIDAWNNEVVIIRNDNNNSHDQNHKSKGNERTWTPEDGGCGEGMKGIKRTNDNQLTVNGCVTDDSINGGVSIEDGLERLETYARYKRSFPG